MVTVCQIQQLLKLFQKLDFADFMILSLSLDVIVWPRWTGVSDISTTDRIQQYQEWIHYNNGF